MKPAQDCQEQLKQLQEDMDEFAYIVSHDLKAPVRAITNLSSWIEEDLGDEIAVETQKNIRLLSNRANRLESMINALLLYSRVTRENMETGTTDLNELIEEISLLHPDIRIQIPETLPVLYTYTDKLYQVFEQLLSNVSVFSTRIPVAVTIEFSRVGDSMYEFVVTDEGGGVPAASIDKIFRLFYTVSPKDTFETVGAGLAITKKIVNFAGGSIRAESNTTENGLTIRFTWPTTIGKKLSYV